ncbi:MAG: ROK family protein [Candidatus Peribacteraceae bacterium]|jgi:glucokinase
MSAKNVIGIDVGGTKSAIASYDPKGWQLLRKEQFPTRKEAGFAAVLEEVLSLADTWKTNGTVALGFGAPGLIRHQEGDILRTPNINGGEGFPLKSTLEKRYGIPVAVENDSNCFALGEALEGAGKGHSVVVGITMGTGVGGGIVVDGKLFRGANGFAGEAGHMLLLPGSPPYETNDRRGEVEQFLSGTAMLKRCKEAKSAAELLEGGTCAYLHPEIVLETAWLCATITHLINPSIIIFGGGTGRALRPFLIAIGEETTRWLMKDTPLPQLSIAALEDPSTRGAAMLTSGLF